MTLIKEKATEMIRRMPEDNMPYVISILQNIEAMSVGKDSAYGYPEYGKETAG